MTGGAGARTSPLPNDQTTGQTGAAHLHALAREPRPTGGAAAAAGREYAAGVLGALGFDVVERPFEYSAAVGELGTPAGGLAMLVVIVAGASAALGKAPTQGLWILLVGAALVLVAGRWAARRGVLDLPIARRRGVNLEAWRRGATPRVWLVAHIDSKSQPVSLVVRAAGIVLLVVAWATATLLAIQEALGVAQLYWWVIGVAIVGALPVIASVVGDRSAGAVDNASGVATVLAAAELCATLPIGVLITDAEELGLAGARAWCRSTDRERAPVLNCDGVDDTGTLTLMWTRPRATRLDGAIRHAAAAAGAELRVIPLIPGVLVDGLAFSDQGWECVTLSRGSIDTLRRIHTRRDDLERLRGEGVTVAARVLASAVRTLAELA